MLMVMIVVPAAMFMRTQKEEKNGGDDGAKELVMVLIWRCCFRLSEWTKEEKLKREIIKAITQIFESVEPPRHTKHQGGKGHGKNTCPEIYCLGRERDEKRLAVKHGEKRIGGEKIRERKGIKIRHDKAGEDDEEWACKRKGSTEKREVLERKRENKRKRRRRKH